LAIERLELRRVRLVPPVLESGVLYVSEEFEVAGHLCACGCGNKVMVPLGETDWSFEDAHGGPTLRPSIGSWQLPCQSHYWISAGRIRWASKWTPEQIESGRRAEEERRTAYFEARKVRRTGVLGRLWQWIVALVRRAFGR